MGFKEKLYIAILAVTLLIFGWYFTDAFSAADQGYTTVADFGPKLWIMLAIYIAVVIAVTIITSIITKIKEGEIDQDFDERDTMIDLKAERITSYTQAFMLFGVLVLVMMEYNTFILAHAILGMMVLTTFIGFGVRLYLYRRGV